MERFPRSGGSPRNSDDLTRPPSRSQVSDAPASRPPRSSCDTTDALRSLSEYRPLSFRSQASDAPASRPPGSQDPTTDFVRSLDRQSHRRLPHDLSNLGFGSGESTLFRRLSSEGLHTLPSGGLLGGTLDAELGHRSSERLRRLPDPSSSNQPDIPLCRDPSHSTLILPLHRRHLLDNRSHSSEVRIEVPTSQDAGQSSLSDEALRTYTERVIKDLKIPSELHDQAKVQIESMYRILEKSERATSEQEYDEVCQEVLKLAPDLTILRWMREGEIGKVAGALFFGGKKTRLETNNIRTKGDLRIARESTGKSYLSRLSDQVTHEMAWRLNEPVYRASLASVLGTASTLTSFAYGGKFEPMAIPINIAATYLDTVIFKKFNYPWNLLITTGLWQGSSFATAYSQLGVDKLTELVKHLRDQ